MKNRIISLLLTLSMVLPGSLGAASLLSPAPARAAGGVNTHYSFTATYTGADPADSDLEANLRYLDHTLEWTDTGNDSLTKKLKNEALKVGAFSMYMPEGGPQSVPYFYIANKTEAYIYDEATKTHSSRVSYSQKVAATATTHHYGLPYEERTTESYKYFAPEESLRITLKEFVALDTTNFEAVNISMDIVQHNEVAGLNIPQDRRLEVWVTLDGTNWLGSAGVRSAKLITGGVSAQLFRIETGNLLDIEGVNQGDTIKGIRILPEGEGVCSQDGLRIHKLSVNKYGSKADFDELSPPENITYATTTDSLRDIVLTEAERTANTAWTTNVEITTETPSGSSLVEGDTVYCTYTTETSYRGPVYERTFDSSRELFQSLLDDKQYTAAEVNKVQASIKGTNHYKETAYYPYGMDCQAFVFNAISRVSTTSAWAVTHTLWATHVKLVDGLNKALSFPVYTSIDMVNKHTAAEVYAHYTNAKPGDIAIHYTPSGGVHTRLVTRVDPSSYSSNTTLYGYYSNIYFTEQTNNVKDYGTYSSSSRIDEAVNFSTLRDQGYVIYTLDDYNNEYRVEDVKVQAVAASKISGKNFVEGGVNIAVSSNYRIIKRQVMLQDADDNILFDSKTDDPTFSEYSSTKDLIPRSFNYSSTVLNNKLKTLEDGKYTLTVNVTTGPFTSVTQETNVETVDIPFTVGEPSYTITVAQPTNGTVDVDKKIGYSGDVVTVTATPNEGYYLNEILVDGQAIESGNTFFIRNDHTVTATFAKQTELEAGTNLNLGNSLDMNFYYAKSNPIEDGYYAKVVHTDANGRTHEQKLLQSQWVDAGNSYQITYEGLAAKQMCDTISVTIYDSKDRPISRTKEDSIRDYAERALTSSDLSAAHDLLVDMLNYGAAAQTHFRYNTDDLANQSLTAGQKARASQSLSLVNNANADQETVYGSNLDLENRIELNFYFTGVTDGMYAMVSYGGNTQTFTKDDANFFRNGKTYQVCVNDLAIANGNTQVTCTVYYANNSEYASATDSINSYLARALEDDTHSWMNSIAVFSATAYDYLYNQ